MANPNLKPTLMQEVAYLEGRLPTAPSEDLLPTLSQFMEEINIKVDEVILKKFMAGFLGLAFLVTLVFNQNAVGLIPAIDLSQYFFRLGPLMGQLISGAIFGFLSFFLTVLFVMQPEEEQYVQLHRPKFVSLIFFAWLFFCMFGNSFSWFNLAWLGVALWNANWALSAGFNVLKEYKK